MRLARKLALHEGRPAERIFGQNPSLRPHSSIAHQQPWPEALEELEGSLDSILKNQLW